MGEATIIDVARLAGVSKSTVSRVITGKGIVAEETRNRIEKAIEELRYTPSEAAKVLHLKQSNVIGVIFPDCSNYYFGLLLKGIIKEATKYSMVVMQCNTYYDLEMEKNALLMLAKQRVSGLIVSTIKEEYGDSPLERSILETLKNFNGPVVYVDKFIKGVTRDYVQVDNYKGGMLVAERIAKECIQKIGLMVANTSLRLGEDRLNGFMDGLTSCGLEIMPDCLFVSKESMTEEEVVHRSKVLLDKLVPGGAVFLSNGFLSKIFMREVFERNLTLGKDIHCVAFDKIELLETFTKIPFSYIGHSEEEKGIFAVKLLMERLENPDHPDINYTIPAKMYENVSEGLR